MTYTVIAGTDTLSATRTVLNGVATRVAPLEFRDTMTASLEMWTRFSSSIW